MFGILVIHGDALYLSGNQISVEIDELRHRFYLKR